MLNNIIKKRNSCLPCPHLKVCNFFLPVLTTKNSFPSNQCVSRKCLDVLISTALSFVLVNDVGDRRKLIRVGTPNENIQSKYLTFTFVKVMQIELFGCFS